MTAKPTTREGYSSEQLDIVTRACLYVFTKLGDPCDEVVVVGGLVPYLLGSIPVATVFNVNRNERLLAVSYRTTGSRV